MKIYLVGGAVRDRLLKLPSHEQDWVVVGATVQELLKQGFQQVGSSFPVFLHPKTHEEYALARQEKKTSPGHQGFSCQFSPDVSLEQDLLRRDLTINAMAMDEHGQIIDPYHGIDDLRDRKLRHVSKAFTEDPLRVLRVARFHAKLYDLGFSIVPETLDLMQDMVNQKELLSLSPERIWQEWLKAFQTPHPEIFLTTLQQCGALQQLLPQLQLTTLQIPWQHLTDPHLRMILVWTHCLVSNSLAQKIQTFKELRKKLNIPTRLTQMTIKYFKLLEYLKPQLMQANTILQLLEQLDSYRCPTDFEQCLQCAVIDQQLTQKQQNILVKLCHACQHLPLPPDLQHHADVPAIKNYLQQTRLQIIEQALSHFL